MAQWFHRSHAAIEFLVPEDQGQLCTAAVGTAKLRLEVPAAEIEQHPAAWQGIAQSLGQTQRRLLGALL